MATTSRPVGRPKEPPPLPKHLAKIEHDDDGRAQIVLTPEMRKEYLGRMMRFELSLCELTEMQANFVLFVLRDPTNFEQAARAAGAEHPTTQAQRWKKNPKIAACIALGEQLREDRTYVTSDRTLHEFAILAFSDIKDYTVNHRGEVTVREGVPEYATRAISQVEYQIESWTDKDGELHTSTRVKLRLWSKTESLKMLALYQRLLSGQDGANLGGHVDNSTHQHLHLHQHLHNTWDFGDAKLTF